MGQLIFGSTEFREVGQVPDMSHARMVLSQKTLQILQV